MDCNSVQLVQALHVVIYATPDLSDHEALSCRLRRLSGTCCACSPQILSSVRKREAGSLSCMIFV